MMVLELILEREESVVIKLEKEEDVLAWMKPVIDALKVRE